MSTWFTSDWHFCHHKPFLYEPRGFQDVLSMNETIIQNHNEWVEPDDDVYCLGDCILSDNMKGMECVRRMNGKLHIILGNHDTEARRSLYMTSCPNVVEVVEAKRIKINGYHFFLCHYPVICSRLDDDKALETKCISLCGHSHTKDPFADIDKGLIYHCEVDAHELRPVSFQHVIVDILRRSLERKDQDEWMAELQ